MKQNNKTTPKTKFVPKIVIKDGEETTVGADLFVADSHSIGCGLWQTYYREATYQEIKERFECMEEPNGTRNT